MTVGKECGHVEIWINPECSKCASALSILEESGVEYVVRHYLDQPPTAHEIEEVLHRLGLQPWDITRMNEPLATELGLPEWDRDPAQRERWIDVLVRNPILIQRPIITAEDGTAVIGRSPEAVRSTF